MFDHFSRGGGVASQILRGGGVTPNQQLNRMPGGMVASRMAAGPFRQQPNYMASTTNSLFSDSRMFSPTPSLMQSRMTNQPAASLLNSGLPPPTSYHTELATIGGLGNGGLMGEFAAADMSMSALYLHNVQHRNNMRRPSLGKLFLLYSCSIYRLCSSVRDLSLTNNS